MKQLIKAAIVYKAEIPVELDAIQKHLAEKPFVEPLPAEAVSCGFVPPSEGDALAVPFPGGFAFRVRVDEKTVPGAVLQKEVERLAKQVQEHTGRKPGKKERAELKEEALLELTKQAFPRTAELTCFYETATNYLIVPTTSQKLADRIITLLVHAVGSVKTSTIHVSNVKHGLTKRLKQWLEQAAENPEDITPAFGRFAPVAEVALAAMTEVGVGARKITVKMGNLEHARAGLMDALSKALEVTSLGLTLDGETEFRLTENFRLKGIQFTHAQPEEDDLFSAEAALEVTAVSAVITELCTMLAYKEENEED